MTSDIAQRRFQDYVSPYLDDAFSLARWLTGNAADAEDVVQDACMRAFGAVAARPPEKPRAYMLAVTRNAAYSWLAKNRPRALVLAGGPEDAEARPDALPDSTPSPEEALIRAANREAVTAAIKALPLCFREVLVMREINELSYHDISIAAGVPMGTVMSRLSRARALLAQSLGAAR